ncbi:MAG: SCO family protein [Candidatus Rokubacteria bacterium]|nr:SCO family protein [Candidatus Rokubacteria bacterium]
MAIIRHAPDFALRDVKGQSVTLAEFRGRVVLLSFTYTSCPAACPLVTQRMALLQSRLREAGLLPSRVGLLSITVDPERDTSAPLARYAKGFGADSDGWRFLRESPERLRPVLAAYDEWTRSLPGGEIDHPARLYLIDPRGQIREIYSLSFFDERQALVDIQTLLREPR